MQHYLAQIEHITQHLLRPTDYHLPQETDPFLFAYVARLIYAPGGEPTIRHRPIQFSLLDVPALLMNERFYNLVLSLLNRNEHALAIDWFTRNVIELRRDQLNTYREHYAGDHKDQRLRNLCASTKNLRTKRILPLHP